MIDCQDCKNRRDEVLRAGDEAHEHAQKFLAELGFEYCAEYEAGNFKSDLEYRMQNFKTLEAAQSFIRDGIGSRQGTVTVTIGGDNVIWTYCDEAESEFRRQMLTAEKEAVRV